MIKTLHWDKVSFRGSLHLLRTMKQPKTVAVRAQRKVTAPKKQKTRRLIHLLPLQLCSYSLLELPLSKKLILEL